MPTTTPDYRLKIARAKAHIGSLATEIDEFLGRNPYTIVAHDNAETRKRSYRVKIQESLPCNWAPIIGDVIHNTRSSLDLLAVSVVRHCDPQRQSFKHVHFIVGETKEKFEARLPKNIKGASPEAIKLFHELKPYPGGNEALVQLHDLDILDKHQAIIPVGSAFHSVNLTAFMQGQWNRLVAEENFPAADFPDFLARPADRMYPLQDGAELISADLDGMMPIEERLQFRFYISFGRDQVLEGEAVVPALLHLCNVVEGIFDIFETHIFK